MQTEITQTIMQKVPLLTEEQQKSLLEEIETLLHGENEFSAQISEQTNETAVHPLSFISRIAVDMGVDDLAEGHSFYAHGKVED